MTTNWNIINDESKANCNAGNEIIYNTEVLESSFCNFNDAYILLKADIFVREDPATQVSFTNCTPSVKCITTIDGATISMEKIKI